MTGLLRPAIELGGRPVGDALARLVTTGHGTGRRSASCSAGR